MSDWSRIVIEAEAEAEALALKGEAEAYAIECKAKAEAEQMAKKADAWKEYKEAAMIDMMLQTLPKVIFMKKFYFIPTNNIFTISGGSRGGGPAVPDQEDHHGLHRGI